MNSCLALILHVLVFSSIISVQHTKKIGSAQMYY